MSKPSGINKDRHEEIGRELAEMQAKLAELDAEIANAYGKSNRPYDQGLAVAIRRLVFARAKMAQRAGWEHEDDDWGQRAYGNHQ